MKDRPAFDADGPRKRSALRGSGSMPAVAPYQRLVDGLRGAFFSPAASPARVRSPVGVRSPAEGCALADALADMLARVESMKSAGPWLRGADVDLAARPEGSRREYTAGLPRDQGQPLDAVIEQLVASLERLPLWNHPRGQANVAPCPTIASALAAMLASIHNPNLVSEENAGGVAAVEVAVARAVALLVGYDQQAAGVFTWGGAGAMLYGVKVGLEKAVPGSATFGLSRPVVVIASEAAHGSVEDAAAWLGIGRSNVWRAATADDFSVSVAAIEALAREAVDQGRRVAAFVATVGSTDAFGIDDVSAIAAMRDRLVDELRLDYRPHIHADAVIGWAWSVFRGYDFCRNELGFRPATLASLAAIQARTRGLERADTLGVDFHKTGFAPYVATLALARNEMDFNRLARADETSPYLSPLDGSHPGRFTLETSRSGAGPLAALASLLLLGQEGYRALLGHAVDMATRLREQLAGREGILTLNPAGLGPATLLRVWPDGSAPADACSPDHDALNRRVWEHLQARARLGQGAALSLVRVCAPGQREPILCLKSFVLSPFVTPETIDAIAEEICEARRAWGRRA